MTRARRYPGRRRRGRRRGRRRRGQRRRGRRQRRRTRWRGCGLRKDAAAADAAVIPDRGVGVQCLLLEGKSAKEEGGLGVGFQRGGVAGGGGHLDPEPGAGRAPEGRFLPCCTTELRVLVGPVASTRRRAVLDEGTVLKKKPSTGTRGGPRPASVASVRDVDEGRQRVIARRRCRAGRRSFGRGNRWRRWRQRRKRRRRRRWRWRRQVSLSTEATAADGYRVDVLFLLPFGSKPHESVARIPVVARIILSHIAYGIFIQGLAEPTAASGVKVGHNAIEHVGGVELSRSIHIVVPVPEEEAFRLVGIERVPARELAECLECRAIARGVVENALVPFGVS